MDPCSITKKALDAKAALGMDLSNLQQKFDLLAKQANKQMDLLGIPILNQLMSNFSQVVNSTLAGVVGQMTKQLAMSINEGLDLVAGVLATLTMIASAGTQVQLLFISQLRRELTVRIMMYRLMLYHYRNILRVLKLLQAPRSISYKKLLAALSYVRKAEALFEKAVIAEATKEGLPARYSYKSIKGAFQNIDSATKLLTADASVGGKELGYTLSVAITGRKIPKKRWEYLGQTLAKDLLFKSIAQSLSYIEYLTWNYMRIASLIPIPFEAVDAIFQPNNYTQQFLTANNTTAPGVQTFNQTDEDAALERFRNALIKEENETLVKTASDVVASLDLLKGIIPTNIIINSLVDTIINYPTFNSELKVATATLITSILPLKEITTNVRTGMEDSLAKQDSELVLAAKEGIWTTQLNSILILKDGILPALEGQARLDQDAYNLETFVKYLEANQGIFVIADAVPKFIAQSLEILRAPFSSRSLEESVVLVTFINRQLEKAVQVDRAVLAKMTGISEPLSQFTELLKMASELPPPMSTVANALRTGQAQQVLGFITALSLGTIDTIKDLFNPNCPEVKVKEEKELSLFDQKQKEIDSFNGIPVSNLFG
jgi:hypothetical protein